MTTALDLATAKWRKSSYSNGGDANCVEVADNIPSAVPVRDSKRPQGPTLTLPPSSWASFLDTLR
ncbi:DUF397 domain-containing protein [Streptomyces triculaminicus]|uniref:DUF397 domain-containing protein n=1 Tax=Streptomyces triculaminicus TaxID=2816232 RepID=A0A939FVN0_9ACTN|nr:DUF397 domain-containing protein [Streptomyces triculaminicus]MBO0656905.1 DUF397 domain-containing protein [Streptomyces triculaminicus]